MSALEAPTEDDADADTELQARLELLEEENRRLREAYGRVTRTRHRRTAIGLAALGVVALLGALLFPAARTVLVILAAVGGFGGLLTWYLTPERFVAAEVGERVSAALADNERRLAAELGLAGAPRYLPRPDDPDRAAVLYLSQREGAELPPADALEAVFVMTDDADHRGVALQPSGGPLLEALRQATPGDLATAPAPLVDQLTDGLVDQFELIDAARPEVDPEEGRASVAVTGSAYGDVDRFDHPVASLLATGLAVGLDTPVELEVDRTPEGRGDYLVTVRWTLPEQNSDD